MTQGLAIYGGFEGTEVMLDQRDWNTNITILSGDINGDDIADDFDNFRTDNVAHVLWLSGGDNILDGIVITGGQASLDIAPTTTVANLTIENYAPYSGGGCYITSNSEIRNCTFRQCNGRYGAALEADSVAVFVLEDCIFENNNSIEGTAGIGWMDNPIIRNCHFENNDAQFRGSGLSLKFTNGLVEDCTFQNNVCLLYTSPSPRDATLSRMPSSA